MIKFISQTNFLLYFIKFLIFNKYISLNNIKYLKRVGNGLSNTFIFKDKYVIKIKNQIREITNQKIYNGSYNGNFFYDTKNKFEREYKILKLLNDIGLAPLPLKYNSYYLIIEYLKDSVTLSYYLEETKDYNIFYKLKEKINLIHQYNIFHGDLNLNNILITKNKDIKFIDFESSFREDLSFNEKVKLEYQIMEKKMKRFYPEIYKKYKDII